MGILSRAMALLGFGGYEAAGSGGPLRKHAAFVRSFPFDEDSLASRAREKLRLEAHDLDRNHGPLFGVCNRIASYTVPRVNATFATASPEWNAAARAFLLRWFRKADVRGRDSFPRLVWLALRQSLLDGDGAFVLLANGQVKPVEAELVRNPSPMPAGRKIVDGVEVDSRGAAVAYWICSRGRDGSADPRTARRIPAPFVVFWRHAYRFDMVRGIAPVDPIICDLIDQKDLHVSYLAKTRNDTHHAAVATMTDGGASLPANMAGLRGGAAEPAREREEGEPPRPETFQDDSLKLWTLRPGEDVKPIVPGTPSANIVEYEASLVRNMSAALGIPAEFWTLDLRGLSWSTANAVVKIAGDAFRTLHEWAAGAIIRPVLDWRLLMAIRDGDLAPAPVAKGFRGVERSEFDKYRLAPPEYLWAAEKEHYDAAQLGQKLGLPMMQRLAAEMGMTWEELLDARKKELVALYRAAEEVSRATGATVSISQFSDSTMPGSQPVPAAPGAGGEKPGGGEDDG